MPPTPEQLLTDPTVQKAGAAPVLAPFTPPAPPRGKGVFHLTHHHLPRGFLPVLFFLAIGLLIYSVRIGVVTGDSMEPTLHEGSHIVVDALNFHFSGISRGDIVVMQNPADTSIVEVKRVVGLPGETVEAEGGTFSVINKDGKRTEFPQGTLIGGAGGLNDFKLQLGPGEYFVLGDNRAKSTDSRDFGPVRLVNIKGTVGASF